MAKRKPKPLPKEVCWKLLGEERLVDEWTQGFLTAMAMTLAFDVVCAVLRGKATR